MNGPIDCRIAFFTYGTSR